MKLNEKTLRRTRSLEPPRRAAPQARALTAAKARSPAAPRRSGSLQGLPAGKPRRTLQRMRRPDLEVSLVELSKHVEESALLDKRGPREQSGPHIDRRAGEYLPSSAFGARLKKSAILKPSVLEQVRLARFASDRQALLVRCVPDALLKCADDELRGVFHKGIFNEDNDTDDSAKLRGVNKNFAALKSGLRALRVEKRRDLRRISALPPAYGAYLARADPPADRDEITHVVVKKRKGYQEDLPAPAPQQDSPSLDGELEVLGKGKPKSWLDSLDLDKLVELDSGEKEKEASSSDRSKSNSMQEEEKSPRQDSPNMEEEPSADRRLVLDPPQPRLRSTSTQKKVKQF